MIEYEEMGVAELTQRITEDLKSDSILSSVGVRGEISNFKYSGPHAYFSLKEGDYLVNCVMFNAIYKLRNRKIEDGTMVRAYGAVRVYAKRGLYQLYTESLKEGKDLGELYRQLEELKKKLTKEGIFNKPKKELPPFPKKIAVVASRTSAAFQDVLKTIRKRYPLVEILLFHTGVQGKSAVPQIVEALEKADKAGADVVLVVRGGGSIEDLWNFNEEEVVRKIYDMKTPVVTGVGHEIDTTLVDYVADLRAPTPTGAAERATPEIGEIRMRIDRIFKGISSTFANKIYVYLSQLEKMEERLNSHSPLRILQMKKQNVEVNFTEIKRSMSSVLEGKSRSLSGVMEALRHARAVRDIEILSERTENMFDNGLKKLMNSILERKSYMLGRIESELKASDPNIPLKKGYSLIYKNGNMVTSIMEVDEGDLLRIIFADGNAMVHVKEVQKDERGFEKDR